MIWRPNPRSGPMAKKRILIVEDERDIREVLTHYLEASGFEVFPAESGEEGLKSLPEALPDLILLDVNLPGIDGYEVCRRVRADARWGRTPVIILTVHSGVKDTVAGLRLGADDYIGKPFDPQEVVARVRALLGRA